MKLRYLGILILATFHELLALSGPFVAGVFVQQLIERNAQGLLISALLLLCLPLLEWILFGLRDTEITLWATGLDSQSRLGILAHLFRVPLKYFLQSKTGELLTRFTDDIRYISDYEKLGFEAYQNTLSLIVMMLILATYHWALALTIFSIGLFYGLQAIILAPTIKTVFLRFMNHLDHSDEYLRERLFILPLTRTMGAGEWESTRYKRILFEEGVPVEDRSALLNLISNLTGAVVQSTNALLIYGIGGYLLLQGAIPLGALVTATVYSIRTALIFKVLYDWFSKRISANHSRERTKELLDLNVEPMSLPAQVVPQLDKLEIRNLSFSYNSDREPVLKNISLTLRKGEIVALVGTSGAGKSTLVNLILGLHRPSSGEIIINDRHNLHTIDQQSWREGVANAPQFPYFFSGTLKSNLLYGMHQEDEHKMFEITKALEMHHVIAQRGDGYETNISQNANFSGGQKQRLGLIRTLLVKNPLLLILDEPTSFLDTFTEKRVMVIIRRLRKERPVLLIAHRLSTVMYADRIVVLEDGQIIENGTHQALMLAGGRYAELYNKESEHLQGKATI